MADQKLLINFLESISFQANPQKLLTLFQRHFRKDFPLFKQHKEFWRFLENNKDLFEEEHFLDASLLRNSEVAIFLAEHLILEDGTFDHHFLKESIHFFKEGRFFVAQSFWYSAPRMDWILEALQKLLDLEIQKQIKKIHAPVQNMQLEAIIRQTLHLSDEMPIKDVDAKKAAVSAFLCDLRQHIGSCFATAPCILIRKFRPDFFFEDLFSLMTKGHLRRVVNGVAYDLPVASSFGKGESEKEFLLDPVIYPRKVLYLFIMLLEKIHFFEKHSFFKKFFIMKKIFRKWMRFYSGKSVHLKMLLQSFFLDFYDLEIEHVEKYRQMQKDFFANNAFLISITSVKKDALIAKAESQFQWAIQTLKSITSNALVKTWEYTVASMSDVKLDFTYWNSFVALGLDSSAQGGIGAVILSTARHIAQDYERQVKILQDQIEQISDYLRALNIRARSASQEQFQAIKQHALSEEARLSRLMSDRDDFVAKINVLSNHLQTVVDKIMELFINYFQEVYDPEILSMRVFDDSPAGFRLVYKHGRQDPNLWTYIFTDEDFLKMLSNFFHLAQSQFLQSEALSPLSDEEVSAFFQAILLHLRTPEFMHSAYERCYKRGRLLFQHFPISFPKEAFKPYVYLSGGTMPQLTKVYFKREEELTTFEKKVKSEEELLAFILDTLYDLPLKVQMSQKQDPFMGLLISNPVHVFILRPHFKELQTALRKSEYAYTYIRDYFLNPAKVKLQAYTLMPFEQSVFLGYLLNSFQKQLPFLLSFTVQSSDRILTCKEFKHFLVKQLKVPNVPSHFLRQFEDLIDYGFFSWLPLFKKDELSNGFLMVCDRLQERLKVKLNSKPFYERMKHFSDFEVFTKVQFLSFVKMCVIDSFQKVAFSFDVNELLQEIFYECGLGLIKPFIFADTNWAREYFAFVLSPSSMELELWRTDYAGQFGLPMSTWNPFFSNEGSLWSIFTEPYQYGFW